MRRKGGTRRVLIRIGGAFLCLVSLISLFLLQSYRQSRLDLKKDDDLYTLEKNVGFHPRSELVYASAAGFIDQTIYYKAKVDADEVKWLDETPVATKVKADGGAPWWWSLSLWRLSREPDTKYYRTESKWPCVYAYSAKSGWLLGTFEYE